ncbi:MAG: MOSC domain, partial [uncultured Acetobacteraceae bacterium]
ARRSHLPLPGEGPEPRSVGGGGARPRRMPAARPPLRARPGRRALRPFRPFLAAQAPLRLLDGERPPRPAPQRLRPAHRPLVHPGAGRAAARRRHRHGGRARGHLRLPRRVPRAGSAWGAAVRGSARPQLHRRRGQVRFDHRAVEPARAGGGGRHGARPHPVPRQRLRFRRRALGGVRTARAGDPDRRGATARLQAHRPLRRDGGEPGHRRARRQAAALASRTFRPRRPGRLCRGAGRRPHRRRRRPGALASRPAAL